MDATLSDCVTFEIGPFTVQVGYDMDERTYFGRVYEGRRYALPDEPFLTVGGSDRPILSVEGLRLALRDDTFDFGMVIPPTLVHDLVAWPRSGKPDITDSTELD